MVDLPAPEGEDKTKSSPRRLISGPGEDDSLNVLNLFSHLVDDDLQVEADLVEFRQLGFGTQRVCLAIELLAEEIKASADRLFVTQQRSGLFEMRGETVELFSNVSFGVQQRNLVFEFFR